MTNDIASVRLYPKRRSAVVMLLVSAAFAAIGVWLGVSKGWVGFIVAGVFGLCFFVVVIRLLPGSTYLHVDRAGFTFCSLFRKNTVPWSVVDEFFVVTIKQSGVKAHSMVGFNYVASYDRAKLGRRIAKFIADCESALPDTYGKKAEELADFMNFCLAEVKSADVEQPPPSNC